jgi:hypothetical protein
MCGAISSKCRHLPTQAARPPGFYLVVFGRLRQGRPIMFGFILLHFKIAILNFEFSIVV